MEGTIYYTILYYLSASPFVHLFLPLIMIFCAVLGCTSTGENDNVSFFYFEQNVG